MTTIKHPSIDRPLSVTREYRLGRTTTGAYVSLHSEGQRWGCVMLDLIGCGRSGRVLRWEKAEEAASIANNLGYLCTVDRDRSSGACNGPVRIEWHVPLPLVAGALNLMVRSLDESRSGVGLTSFAMTLEDITKPVRSEFPSLRAHRAAARLATDALVEVCFERLIFLPANEYV